MRRERCPYCHGTVEVSDADAGKSVQCDKVRCGKFFVAGVLPPVDAPVNPAPHRDAPVTMRPQLTGPHRCPVCLGEYNQALNRRRCTVVHRPARTDADDTRDHCRMDVYAAIYFCPCCSPGTLLETPASQWGTKVTCPICKATFRAPRDDVLHERAGDAREGVAMQFACPACERELRCDSLRDGQSIAGTRVVCLHCRHLIEVPPHGERVARLFGAKR
jgi:hypothetical protein